MACRTIHFPFVLVCICVFVGWICSPAYAQPTGNPIIDAPKFKAAIDNLKSQRDSVHAQVVLDFANANSSKHFENYQQMKNHFKSDNVAFKYINSLLEGITIANAENIEPASDKALSTSAEFQAGLLGTSAIDALGSFIAERFKQEMEIAFLQKFKEWLEGTSKASEALRILLPNTKKVLSQNDPYQYTVFLETLKESLRKDMNDIPVNIGIYLSSDPFGLAAQTPYYYTSLVLYNNVVQVVNGQPIIEVLKNLENDSLLPKSPLAIQSIIYLTSLTSQLLNNPDRPEDWLDIRTIRNNLNTNENIKIFIELLLLKYKPLLEKIKTGSGGTNNLYQVIVSNKEKLNKVMDWIKGLAEGYSALKTNYATIKDAVVTGTGVRGNAIIDFENSLIAVLKSFFKLREFGVTIDASVEQVFDKVVIQVQLFTGLVVNIKEKNYGLALTSAIEMLSAFVNDPNAINLIKKYGNFAVSVAKAESKDDMLAALRTAALPVGSYRIKRNAYSNISLNAYAGVAGGLPDIFIRCA